MAENREKRDRLCKRLERHKQLAQEKLREEQECIKMVKMEAEIRKLNDKRLVVSNKTSRVINNRSTVKLRASPKAVKANRGHSKTTLKRSVNKPHNMYINSNVSGAGEHDKHDKHGNMSSNHEPAPVTDTDRQRIEQWLRDSTSSWSPGEETGDEHEDVQHDDTMQVNPHFMCCR